MARREKGAYRACGGAWCRIRRRSAGAPLRSCRGFPFRRSSVSALRRGRLPAVRSTSRSRTPMRRLACYPPPPASPKLCRCAFSRFLRRLVVRSRSSPGRGLGFTGHRDFGRSACQSQVWSSGGFSEVEVHHVDLSYGYGPDDWPFGWVDRGDGAGNLELRLACRRAWLWSSVRQILDSTGSRAARARWSFRDDLRAVRLGDRPRDPRRGL